MPIKRYLLLLFSLISCCITIRAQYSMGNTGLLNIPTADMQETGTFMGGGNYLPNGMTPFNFNTGNYFINITFLSILEMSYRCTLLKTTRYDGKKGYFQQDRSMTARLRPLKEGRFHPSVVIGVDDPFKNTGNNYFGTVYGVLTKSFSIAGRDRLALTAGYYIPINDRSIQKGPFGGISYSPAFYREIAFMAEYDSDGFNIGAATRLWKHISLHIFTRDFKCVSGGIRYECKLLH
ncbi:YjbH domain-containing protein [Bacteroides eggerthii]|uniref:YjbH domain-containing protein n=2 Tax=Bacteroides eggerthii TaxID=28111 RepID=UPI001C37CFB5|nr:YjbH domain-containing protein [Bacteroides eggerthii]MBV3843088.1 YjbH domain-containing protein [Bacteroides eggerthii]MBV3846417.1 YjbH domain-containing protein [Bacteroides eggerthii]MBV3884183.1 YjbH domain-containing protein [Bacteroides eggerthii]MBV3891132.1 YjbH domain-containing protein [Bacteroides eggerthii]MBV3902293.1 YjbH domain-containing protein [Bacteroides eggerthii]